MNCMVVEVGLLGANLVRIVAEVKRCFCEGC